MNETNTPNVISTPLTNEEVKRKKAHAKLIRGSKFAKIIPAPAYDAYLKTQRTKPQSKRDEHRAEVKARGL
jgi:hypothetical protein